MSALTRIVDVRPGEGALAFKAFAALFGLIAGHTILETARDALFLEKLPADRLTFVYLALAGVGLVVPAYNLRFVRLFGRRNSVIGTLMLGAAGTTLWYFQPPVGKVLYGIYLWSGLLGTVIVVQFWMFIAQLFTLSQGKRLFPGVAAGGVLGAVAGGSVAAGLLSLLPHYLPERQGVNSLLLLAAGFYLLTAALLTLLPADPQSALGPGKEQRIFGSSLAVLREEPYVGRLAALVAISTATVLAIDYLFKYVAKDTIPAAELGDFFARYYAVLNAVALITQLFVSMRIVQRFGVVIALAVLPLLLLAGSGGVMVLSGAFVMVLLTKGVDGALRHSLHRVTMELMYLPLSGEIRDRAKSLLDAVFVRGTQALTAGAILLLATLGLQSVRVLAGLTAGLAVLWVLCVLALRRPYLNLFRKGLRRGVLDPELLQAAELDINSVESVMAALSSIDPHRVIAAMNLLAEANRLRLIPALILYHDDETVLLRALELLETLSADDLIRDDVRPHLARLLKHNSDKVRTAVVRFYGRAGDVDAMKKASADDSALVRAHAAFHLAQLEPGSDPRRHEAIVQLLTWASADPERLGPTRMALLDALREGADERWTDVLLELAEIDTPIVIERVAMAMARVKDPRFIPLLIRRLSVRDGRAAVREALAAIGEPAREAIEKAMDDRATPSAVQLHIPRAMAAFGDQAACDVLTRWLAEDHPGSVRFKVLRALGRLAARESLWIDRPLIVEQLDSNLREYFRLLSLDVPLQESESDGSLELLRGLLSDKMKQARERIFRLFQLLHPREDIRGVNVALDSTNERRRANAFEFLETLALRYSDALRLMLRLVGEE
ncbi:HEAT repeat domain-containing protein, partial [Desulfobulbus sp. AH-315-M07]|nr:HEAT repeat domain-containing protein [Desulfobulbus sp. AH-315-M07]